MARADITRAVDAGLTFRPLAETVRDTYAWDASEPGERPTLTREREAEILSGARAA
jgi:2'-hydroxyisoflavone reductase